MQDSIMDILYLLKSRNIHYLAQKQVSSRWTACLKSAGADFTNNNI